MRDGHDNVSGQKTALPPPATRVTRPRGFWAAAHAPLWVLGALLAYALVLFSDSDGLFRYSPDNLRLMLITVLAALAMTALLIHSGLRTNRALDAEQRARASISAILESITDGFVAIDRDWCFTYANAEAEKLLGKTRRELVGRIVWQVVPGMDRPVFHENYLKAIDQRVATLFEAQLKPERFFEVHAYPSDEGISVYFRDVTEQRQSRALLQASEERYRELVENASDLVYTHDLVGNITSVNNACVTLTGFTHGELLRMNLADLIAPEHIEHARGMLRKKIKQGGGTTTYELEVVARDGRRVPVEVSSRLMSEKRQPATAVQGIARDISERKRAEEVLRNMSLTDPLTGVYNRRGAITLADQQLKVAQRLGRSLLIVYADLNHLKQINDTYGHTAGDAALVEVAEVLRETFRESDIVARIGGDEFVVLLESTGADESTLRRRLLDSLTARNARGARPFDLSLSLGIARFDPERARAFEDLMGEADRRMYEDKRIAR